MLNIGGGRGLFFFWNDDSGKILITSPVKEVDDDGDNLKVVTQNSIYFLEKATSEKENI